MEIVGGAGAFQVDGSFNTGVRVRMAECLRQTVPNRRANVRKRSFTICFFVYNTVSVVRGHICFCFVLFLFFVVVVVGRGVLFVWCFVVVFVCFVL